MPTKKFYIQVKGNIFHHVKSNTNCHFVAQVFPLHHYTHCISSHTSYTKEVPSGTLFDSWINTKPTLPSRNPGVLQRCPNSMFYSDWLLVEMQSKERNRCGRVGEEGVISPVPINGQPWLQIPPDALGAFSTEAWGEDLIEEHLWLWLQKALTCPCFGDNSESPSLWSIDTVYVQGALPFFGNGHW